MLAPERAERAKSDGPLLPGAGTVPALQTWLVAANLHRNVCATDYICFCTSVRAVGVLSEGARS